MERPVEAQPADNIFSTWEWQSSWWKAYQAGELWLNLVS